MDKKSVTAIDRLLAKARKYQIIEASLPLCAIAALFYLTIVSLESLLPRTQFLTGWGFLLFFLGASLLAARTILRRWQRPEKFLEKNFGEFRSDLSTWLEWRAGSKINALQFSQSLYEALEEDVATRTQESRAWRELSFSTLARRHALEAVIFLTTGMALLTYGTPNVFWSVVQNLAGTPSRPQSRNIPALHIGNLQVEYRYPSYAKLDHRPSAPITDRTITALKGTRALISFEVEGDLSSMVLSGPRGEIQPLTQAGRSKFSGEILLTHSGSLTIQGKDVVGGERADPEKLNLQVIPDEPPQVNLTLPTGDQKVTPKSELEFQYQARDDFGISSMKLKLNIDQSELIIPLQKAGGKIDDGNYRLRLSQLPISERTEMVTAQIVAADNDEVSGMKEGGSPLIRLLLQNKEGERVERMQNIGRWMDTLLLVLADDLETQALPPVSYTAAWVGGWQENARSLERLQRELRESSQADSRTNKIAKELKEGLQTLVQNREKLRPRSNQNGWTDFLTDYPPHVAKEVESVEQLLSFLDHWETADRADQVMASIQKASNLASDLSERISQMNGKELDAALQEMQRALDDMMRSLANLASKAPPEHINPEGLDNQEWGKIQKEMSRIQDLIRQGKVDEAKKAMQAQLEKLKALSQKMKTSSQKMANSRDQKLREDWNDMKRSVEALKREERALAQETQKMQPNLGANGNAPDSLLNKVVQLKQELRSAKNEVDTETSEPWRTVASAALAKSQLETSELQNNVGEADFEAAYRNILNILSGLDQLITTSKNLRSVFDRTLPPHTFGKLLKGTLSIARSQKIAEEIAQILRSLNQEPEANRFSQGEKEKGDQLAQKQKRLREKTSKLEQRLQEFNEKTQLWKSPPAGLKQAQDRMSQAEDELGKANPKASVRHQRDAISELNQVQRDLQEAERDMQDSGSESGGIQLAQDGDPGAGPQDQIRNESVIIPETSRSKETEEWRKKLMEGMKQKPPMGYEDVTKKYFEELLNQ